MLAAQLFEQALPVAAEFCVGRAPGPSHSSVLTSSAAGSSGDRRANQIRESFTTRLMQIYADTATEDLALV